MCQEMEIAIPNELSLTGFEDLELASNVTPPLTTVHFPTEELGVRAGEEILKRIANEPTPGQIELSIKLVARGTTSQVQGADVPTRVRASASRETAKIT
jgi:LacI family transcriptional regulator